MFHWLRNWRERRGAMHELKRFARDEAGMLVLDDANPLQRAKMALESGDRDAARHYLALARERLPGYVLSSPDTIIVLLGLNDLDELERFARDGMARYPRKAQYIEGLAMAAERRHHFEQAAERWALARRKFPYAWRGYAHGAGCLRELGQLDQALSVVRRGLRTMPEQIHILLEAARVLEAQKDWPGLMRLWAPMRQENAAGCAGYAYALARGGKRAEAEAELEKGRDRYRTDVGIEVTAARIAQDAGDTAEAARRLDIMRKRFPYDIGAFLHSLQFLRDQKLWPEADAVATTAVERFPKEEWPRAEYAILAEMRQDWNLAAERWRGLRESFPNYRPGWQREAACLDAAGRRAEAEALRAQENAQFNRSPPPC